MVGRKRGDKLGMSGTESTSDVCGAKEAIQFTPKFGKPQTLCSVFRGFPMATV
jgi:hypothetical protein